MARLRGKRFNWASMWMREFGEYMPKELGRDRRIMGYRIENGKVQAIGIMGPSHPSASGNTALPRRKRRTIPHNKGAAFPGMWRNHG